MVLRALSMRIPFTNLYRAFPEFDSLSEDECRRYVHYVRTEKSFEVYVVPSIAAGLVGIALPVLLVLANRYDWVKLPVPQDVIMRVLVVVVSDVVVAAFTWLLLRDLALWWGVRAEVHRARCPKCKQSLQGLNIEEIGLGLDPRLRFVRCAECGRKYRLMDLGLSPMDLVPFEQRGVPEDFGKVRHLRRRD